MRCASHFCDLTIVFLLLARHSLYKYHFVLARSSVLREKIPPFGVSHTFFAIIFKLYKKALRKFV